MNIINSKNGAGKSTLLHVLANVLEADFERFLYISFEKIQLKTVGGYCLSLVQESGGDEGKEVEVISNNEPILTITREHPETTAAVRSIIREHLGGRPVYLPAFRTVLEALTRPRYNALQRRALAEHRHTEFDNIVKQEMAEEETRKSKDEFRKAMRAREVELMAMSTAQKTMECREWFGPFLPKIRFPSVAEVETQLSEEVTVAQLAVGAIDRKGFADVFERILHVVISSSINDVKDISKEVTGYDQALQFLRSLLLQLEDEKSDVPEAYLRISTALQKAEKMTPGDESLVRRVLDVYNSVLEERINAQKTAFRLLQIFEESVNRFFKDADKKLVFSQPKAPRESANYTIRRARPCIEVGDNLRVNLPRLSSGERHVLTMLFSVTHMSTADGVVLIDEPELSLHVDWQRIILSEVAKQVGTRQIIACTHAPEVAAEHLDKMTQLEPRFRSMNQDLSEDTFTE